MDVLEAIFTRKSIRKYTGEPVTNEQLKTIFKAGFCAPSCGNARPWHFIAIKEKTKLEEISKFHNYAKMLPAAGCCIIVCGDREKLDSEGFLIEDCSAAIENMLLAIHGMGLGAVWCGLHPNTAITEPLTKLLNIPPTILAIGMVVVGNKAENREANERFDETRIHYEQW